MSAGGKAPAWKRREIAHVERTLGAGVICATCGATLATIFDACTAGLADRCPGFEVIERAKRSAPANCRP